VDILVYTFRTFPYLEELRKIFQNVVVFGRLKEDLQDFYDLIVKENPKFILGVALSNNNNSFFEPKTINQFNKNAKVVKNRNFELSLFVPDLKESNFKISSKFSDSFCNYSMYKIKDFLEQKELDIPFSFLHVKKEQIEELNFILRLFSLVKFK